MNEEMKNNNQKVMTKYAVMTLDGIILYSIGAATIKQLLVVLKEIKSAKGKTEGKKMR
jgi:hypothetical protein